MDRTAWDEILKHGAYSQELDWFALDLKGQVGIFTASMNAPIPEKVKESFGNYQTIVDKVASLRDSTSPILITEVIGNFQEWLTYAARGIFAFDFQDIHRTFKKNQYDLIAKPIEPITIKDLNLPEDYFPRLNCVFDKEDVEMTLVK